MSATLISRCLRSISISGVALIVIAVSFATAGCAVIFLSAEDNAHVALHDVRLAVVDWAMAVQVRLVVPNLPAFQQLANLCHEVAPSVIAATAFAQTTAFVVVLCVRKHKRLHCSRCVLAMSASAVMMLLSAVTGFPLVGSVGLIVFSVSHVIKSACEASKVVRRSLNLANRQQTDETNLQSAVFHRNARATVNSDVQE
jgi:hypothetical protein